MNAPVPNTAVDRLVRTGLRLPLYAKGAELRDADGNTVAVLIPHSGHLTAADRAKAFADLANEQRGPARSYASLEAGFSSAGSL